MKKNSNVINFKNILSTVKNFFKNNFKKLILLVVALIILAIIIIGGYIGINYITNMKYSKYEKNMTAYGLTEMYDNYSAKSYQFVTKSEAIKIIIAATINSNDISYLASDYLSNDYSNEIWVDYAANMGIISKDYITITNQNQKESYINIITEISNARRILLNRDDSTNELDKKQFSKFSDEQKIAINNLISIDVLENKKFNGNKNTTKGMLNELIVKYMKNDNILTSSDEKINTDVSKMPSNANEFPYTVESVDNSTYEKEQYYFTGILAKSPIDVYKDNKQNYNGIKSKVENYLNTLFNVDYTNISYDQMKENINKYVEINTDPDKLNSYIDFVKSNEIVITGTAKVQDPIIYYDGMRYRVRTKVNFTVKSAKDLNNLIYLDDTFSEKVQYTSGENEILFDIPVKKLIGDFYIDERALSNSITGKVVNVYLSDGTDPMEGVE